MSSSEERERARQRLRELAESTAPTPADSSGYVDLSAYSASDSDWVEHALARSKSGEVASQAPTYDSRPLGSVAPIEVTKPTEPPPAPHRSVRRPLMMASAILASTAAALLLVLHPFASRGSGAGADRADAKRVAVTAPSAATPFPIAAVPPVSTSTASAAPNASAVSSASAATAVIAVPTGGGTTAPRPRVPIAAAAGRPRAPSRPSPPSIPKNKSGGGDALTAAILQSIAAPSGDKK
jgi:hypothetical protein